MEKILLWRGCIYRKHLKEELKTLEKVFNSLKIKYTTLEEECCGYPLHLMGSLDGLTEIADRNSKRLQDYSLIVTPCPACLRCFTEVYTTIGVETSPIIHITSLLAERAEKGEIYPGKLRRLNLKAMYHDPCELGRGMNIYDQPRTLIEMIPGVTLQETRFSKEISTCCGGGGLLPALTPSIASLIAARKLLEEDRIPEDLDVIVTACPQCLINLRRGIHTWSDREVRVLDITQLIKETLRD